MSNYKHDLYSKMQGIVNRHDPENNYGIITIQDATMAQAIMNCQEVIAAQQIKIQQLEQDIALIIESYQTEFETNKKFKKEYRDEVQRLRTRLRIVETRNKRMEKLFESSLDVFQTLIEPDDEKESDDEN